MDTAQVPESSRIAVAVTILLIVARLTVGRMILPAIHQRTAGTFMSQLQQENATLSIDAVTIEIVQMA